MDPTRCRLPARTWKGCIEEGKASERRCRWPLVLLLVQGKIEPCLWAILPLYSLHLFASIMLFTAIIETSALMQYFTPQRTSEQTLARNSRGQCTEIALRIHVVD
ncbi:unnamed protein product [Thelazia callipaeda]|uniref:Uncharacterized protein n=1 Tax=Thelazia callipaeda TaxID=103827 RepID=A0A0N5CUS0_THECL|nr:unnamed protein product [Thelazia callipaeda]